MKRPPLYFDAPLWNDRAPSMFRSLRAMLGGPFRAKVRWAEPDEKIRAPRLRVRLRRAS
jgi:hypothetical protein